MQNRDVVFKRDLGKETMKKVGGLRDWLEAKAPNIRKDKYLERAFWRLIDAADNVVAILEGRYQE